jgi:hypothetical protein
MKAFVVSQDLVNRAAVLLYPLAFGYLKNKRPPFPGGLTQSGSNGSRALWPHDILSLQAFWTSLHLKLHLYAFIQRTIPIHLDRRKMYKHVLAVGALNEPIALGGVKPFHNSFFSHNAISSLVVTRVTPDSRTPLSRQNQPQ